MDARTLKKVMPRCPSATRWAPVLTQALVEAEATTVPRAAAFLAQLAHESGECRWLREIADGSTYEGRKDLGNMAPGDGRRYRGRGLIQLTGRRNYKRASAALGLELEKHPEMAEEPGVAGRVAAWYWRTHDCNRLADRFDFNGVTRQINGGLNGLAHRQAYYLKALSVLSYDRGWLI